MALILSLSAMLMALCGSLLLAKCIEFRPESFMHYEAWKDDGFSDIRDIPWFHRNRFKCGLILIVLAFIMQSTGMILIS